MNLILHILGTYILVPWKYSFLNAVVPSGTQHEMVFVLSMLRSTWNNLLYPWALLKTCMVSKLPYGLAASIIILLQILLQGPSNFIQFPWDCKVKIVCWLGWLDLEALPDCHHQNLHLLGQPLLAKLRMPFTRPQQLAIDQRHTDHTSAMSGGVER